MGEFRNFAGDHYPEGAFVPSDGLDADPQAPAFYSPGPALGDGAPFGADLAQSVEATFDAGSVRSDSTVNESGITEDV